MANLSPLVVVSGAAVFGLSLASVGQADTVQAGDRTFKGTAADMFCAGFYEKILTEDAVAATDFEERDLHRLLGAFRGKIIAARASRTPTKKETNAGFDGIMLTRRWILDAKDSALGPEAKANLNTTFANCEAHLGS